MRYKFQKPVIIPKKNKTSKNNGVVESQRSSQNPMKMPTIIGETKSTLKRMPLAKTEAAPSEDSLPSLEVDPSLEVAPSFSTSLEVDPFLLDLLGG